jgi:hypothetical protein
VYRLTQIYTLLSKECTESSFRNDIKVRRMAHGRHTLGDVLLLQGAVEIGSNINDGFGLDSARYLMCQVTPWHPTLVKPSKPDHKTSMKQGQRVGWAKTSLRSFTLMMDSRPSELVDVL